MKRRRKRRKRRKRRIGKGEKEVQQAENKEGQIREVACLVATSAHPLAAAVGNRVGILILVLHLNPLRVQWRVN